MSRERCGLCQGCGYHTTGCPNAPEPEYDSEQDDEAACRADHQMDQERDDRLTGDR